MKCLIYLVLLAPALVFAGVGNKDKEGVKREFVKACVEGGETQMPDDDSRQMFRDYCACAGEKVAQQFTIAELEDINRVGKTQRRDSYESKLIQDKLMKVIKPCLEELKVRAKARYEQK